MQSLIVSLQDKLAGSVRKASLVLLGLVVFVLLIACANVAHLLLARVAERRQELAIRGALGASRARLVQQLITESTLLTVIAAGAGLGVAQWAAQVAAAAQPAQLAAARATRSSIGAWWALPPGWRRSPGFSSASCRRAADGPIAGD